MSADNYFFVVELLQDIVGFAIANCQFAIATPTPIKITDPGFQL